MRPAWLWDRNMSIEEVKAITQDSLNPRFAEMAALLLSRNNAPKEIFEEYLDKKMFVQNWNRVKRQMRKDSWNNPRIIFWQAVYEKIASEFKEKGIPIRQVKEVKAIDDLPRQIAEKLRVYRQNLNLTQKDLADRIGISQQIISRIEKGRDDMRLLTLSKIFSFLGEQIVIDSRPSWIEGKVYSK